MIEPILNKPAEPRYLYVQTFGCQMNEYDSLRVRRILAAQGYATTEDINAADVIFLNTCSVREKAEQKVHSFLGRLRKIKARNPGLKIIVAGCLAQQWGSQFLKRFEHLDLVLGTRAISSIGDLLERLQETDQRLTHLPDEEEETARFEQLYDAPQTVLMKSEVAAPVTIMQGCNNFCTYCIVPYVRGRERSRPSSEIIREIRQLSAEGAREILLLGQNVNSYGRGLKERISFVDLLHRIASETDILRLRFTTSHPKDLTRELIRSFADLDSLCKHLHLPVQSGSDRILKLMNRSYTSVQYMENIRSLRDVCPEIAVTSDVMVGFPGETEEDFQLTMHLLDEVRFDNLFSFRYSDRPFAKATGFSDKVAEEVKGRRLFELQSFQAETTLSKNRAEVGKTREILVEGPSKASGAQMSGRTSQNRIVNFKGTQELKGRLVHARILSAFSHSLVGELVGAEAKDYN
jgi:tRNA-2-methylthio-N6-dimethylallyladenosine synthase